MLAVTEKLLSLCIHVLSASHILFIKLTEHHCNLDLESVVCARFTKYIRKSMCFAFRFQSQHLYQLFEPRSNYKVSFIMQWKKL